MNPTAVYRTLTYWGLIPFAIAALMPYLGVETLGPLGPWDRILVVYGLAIASFLAGTHWAFDLVRPEAYPLPMFVVSNVIVVVAWIAALVGPSSVAIAVEIVIFAALLAVDRVVYRHGGTSLDYWVLRLRITALVVLALLIGFLAPWLA